MKSIERLLSALKPKLVFPSVAILAIIVLASLGIYKATQATVVVAEDGKSETIKTHAKTVKDLFDALDINVNEQDRKSTRLNSSHVAISYAVFCLKKKKKQVDTEIEQGIKENV